MLIRCTTYSILNRRATDSSPPMNTIYLSYKDSGCRNALPAGEMQTFLNPLRKWRLTSHRAVLLRPRHPSERSGDPQPVTVGGNWTLKSFHTIRFPCLIDFYMARNLWERLEVLFLEKEATILVFDFTVYLFLYSDRKVAEKAWSWLVSESVKPVLGSRVGRKSESSVAIWTYSGCIVVISAMPYRLRTKYSKMYSRSTHR